jgi:carboxymethylenebutenolidase
MGEIVEFASNGHGASGYLAVPESGGGPGVIVIQEWWGLVPHITDVCDRFAAAGFVALAPDLYHGETTTEPDEAGKLMMALNLDQAAKDMGGAVDHLLGLEAVTSAGVGVVGFCMGGALALLLAVERPDQVQACAPFYGTVPFVEHKVDWSKLQAPVRGHFAGDDDFFTKEKVIALEGELKGLGKDCELVIHEGADHAFFNDSRPEVYDAEHATEAWDQTVAFFRDAVR